MEGSIKKFILRSLLAALPVFLLVALYAWRDPFHVVHPVTRSTAGQDSVQAGNNAGFVAVETYFTHNDERHFDSFIFGSSMSQNYKAQYWKPYLNDSASILHFDASAETLEGIINKMHLLNNNGSTIKNALIVIEADMLGRQPLDDNLLYIQHPLASGWKNWFRFHTIYFNAFKNLTQVKYALCPSMFAREMQSKGMISDEKGSRIDAINEVFYATTDSLIANDPSKFFTPQRMATRKHTFYPAPSKPGIDDAVEAQLREIKAILDNNGTSYLILIPPCNVKPHLTWADLWIMKSIFGQNEVQDLSSHPQFINNEHFYYDQQCHLISAKCKEVLDSAYYRHNHPTINNPFIK